MNRQVLTSILLLSLAGYTPAQEFLADPAYGVAINQTVAPAVYPAGGKSHSTQPVAQPLLAPALDLMGAELQAKIDRKIAQSLATSDAELVETPE